MKMDLEEFAFGVEFHGISWKHGNMEGWKDVPEYLLSHERNYFPSFQSWGSFKASKMSPLRQISIFLDFFPLFICSIIHSFIG